MPRKRNNHKVSGQERFITKVVRKLRISDGDVLLIKKDSSLATKEALDALGKLFEQFYKFRIVFVVVDELDDIKRADPEVMKDAGWIRWPRGRLSRLIEEANQEENEETNESGSV